MIVIRVYQIGLTVSSHLPARSLGGRGGGVSTARRSNIIN